jgi:putative photosynthetic complex assembly protein
MHLNPKGVALAIGVVLPLALFLGLVLRPGLETPPRSLAEGPARTVAPRTMEVRFVELDDGQVRVEHAGTGETLRTVTAATGGLLWGIVRPLERERNRRDASLDEPYLLRRTAEGRMVLEDPQSDLRVDLAAFGGTSAAIFEALITGGPAPSIPPLMTTPPSMEDRP